MDEIIYLLFIAGSSSTSFQFKYQSGKSHQNLSIKHVAFKSAFRVESIFNLVCC